MLPLKIPAARCFDEEKEEFVEFPAVTLKLEHSLISIHRWEAKWHKSFLSNTNFTAEEMVDYVQCMSIDQSVDPTVFARLTRENIEEIKNYMTNPMTATTFSNKQERPGRQIITAELIYYWMTSFNIPFECAKWHLNQLMTLIRICGIKSTPSKKGNKRQLGEQRAALNKARRAKLGTSG